MAHQRLRYSQRKKIAETGDLGELSPVPSGLLRNAVTHAYDRAISGLDQEAQPVFQSLVQDECEEHFGWGKEDARFFATRPSDPEVFVDFVEILVEIGPRRIRYLDYSGYHFATGWADVEADINRLFERHRFGFRIDSGEAREIASPALDEVIVGPALLASSSPGWEEVERRYREALHHQRGGPDENDDALTAANAALESALKAVGVSGKTLAELGKNFKKSNLVPGYLQGVPSMLDSLLQRSSAIRNVDGDAHGKEPGARDVPDSLVNLSIHLAGSYIVYLSEVATE